MQLEQLRFKGLTQAMVGQNSATGISTSAGPKV